MDTKPPKADIRANINGVVPVIPELAAEIGLEESLLLMQICHWIKISNNFEDGKWWTFQSVRDIRAKAFPYLSVSTINRAINRMETMGLIETTAKYNERKYDKTRWFTLNMTGLSRLKSVTLVTTDGKLYPVSNCNTLFQNDTRSSQNDTRSTQFDTRSTQNETTIPDSTTDSTTDISTDSKEKDISPMGEPASHQLFRYGILLSLLKATNKTSTPRSKDPLQEATAHAFKIGVGGFAASIITQLTASKAARGERKEWVIDDPPMTAKEIVAFGVWYNAIYGEYSEKPPTGAERLYERVQEFRSDTKHYKKAMERGEDILNKLLNRQPPPPPPEPEETVDEAAAEAFWTMWDETIKNRVGSR